MTNGNQTPVKTVIKTHIILERQQNPYAASKILPGTITCSLREWRYNPFQKGSLFLSICVHVEMLLYHHKHLMNLCLNQQAYERRSYWKSETCSVHQLGVYFSNTYRYARFSKCQFIWQTMGNFITRFSNQFLSG